MRADELDYDLPSALIAQEPPAERDGARLLVVERGGAELLHRQVVDLPACLERALFVLNDTQVIPARLLGQRPSGGRFEVLLIERTSGEGVSEEWLAMGRPLKSLKPGLVLALEHLVITVGERVGASMLRVRLEAAGGVLAALQRVGHVPLPPYITRGDNPHDTRRYQTIFAREPGAVAAPTASLHFSPGLLDALERQGHERAFVTLHVGPGTFAPLAVDDLRDHPMHEERYHVPDATVEAIARAKSDGRPVVAVGTTVMRTLEAAAAKPGGLRAGAGRTRICIYPPYQFLVADALLTNFHLPRSTLLALVMAFAGVDTTRLAYAGAVAGAYRFFSYGDAMLVKPRLAAHR
ncbi:MAG: tRNA preQ1(34) S-adenosylmethionine ribosyltransferase-isomerase QueA [Pseudomonadota bacterium]|jgi:S-adenosylmethionine:tRNA ribosyltransferase-isomerase